MKRLALTLSALLLSLPLFAQSFSSARMIPLSSPLYDEVDLLYRFDGLALPSASRPWSSGEAKLLLERIANTTQHRDLLDQATRRIEDKQMKEVSPTFSYLLSTTVNLEGYAHSNTTRFTTAYDWVYSVDERKPLFRFRMEMGYSNRFYFSTSVDIGSSMAHDNDDNQDYAVDIGALFIASDDVFYQAEAYKFTSQLMSNLLIPGDKALADWPQESQFSLSGNWWSLTTGRGALNWGRGESGNFVLGDHIANHNHLKATFFAEQAKLEFLYLFLPNPIGKGEQRIFLGHRGEAQLSSWARIAVTENVMYQGETIQIAYLDPTYIYHNLYDAKHLNAIASIELDMTILPALSLHGQFALDQFQLPNETDTSTANALAGLVNLSYSWHQSGYWTASAEFATTAPTFYRRDGIDFLFARGLHNNGQPILIDYLGYQYGSDSQAFAFNLAYHSLSSFRVEFNTTILRKGQVTYLTSHHDPPDNTEEPNIKGFAPSGDIITEYLILGLKGIYASDWMQDLSFHGQVNWIGRRTFSKITGEESDPHSDLQLILGCSLTF
jgi:hypothetical protein